MSLQRRCVMCWQWTEVCTRHQQEDIWKFEQGGWQEGSTQRWWLGRSLSQVSVFTKLSVRVVMLQADSIVLFVHLLISCLYDGLACKDCWVNTSVLTYLQISNVRCPLTPVSCDAVSLISVKLAMNIHKVRQLCWTGFQGQRSKVKMIRPNAVPAEWYLSTDSRLFIVCVLEACRSLV